MTEADKLTNPQHFGRDLAHIQINPAIQIGIPDHFWLTFWRWQRFARSEHSLVCSRELVLTRPEILQLHSSRCVCVCHCLCYVQVRRATTSRDTVTYFRSVERWTRTVRWHGSKTCCLTSRHSTTSKPGSRYCGLFAAGRLQLMEIPEILEFVTPSGNTGNLLEFNCSSWKLLHFVGI